MALANNARWRRGCHHHRRQQALALARVDREGFVLDALVQSRREKIAMVALSMKHWLTIEADPAGLIAACDGAGEGSYTVVTLPRPRRRRRPPQAQLIAAPAMTRTGEASLTTQSANAIRP